MRIRANTAADRRRARSRHATTPRRTLHWQRAVAGRWQAKNGCWVGPAHAPAGGPACWKRFSMSIAVTNAASSATEIRCPRARSRRRAHVRRPSLRIVRETRAASRSGDIRKPHNRTLSGIGPRRRPRSTRRRHVARVSSTTDACARLPRMIEGHWLGDLSSEAGDRSCRPGIPGAPVDHLRVNVIRRRHRLRPSRAPRLRPDTLRARPVGNTTSHRWPVFFHG